MNSSTSFLSEGEDMMTSSSIFSNSSPKSVACISSRFDPSRLGQYPQKLYIPNEDGEDTDGSKSVTSAASTGTTTSTFTTNGYSDNTKQENLVHTVNKNDVLCGRGRGPAGHTGNIRFHELVAKKRMAYLTCTDRKEKANICEEIIDVVKRSGGRFLKKVSGSGSKTSPRLWKIVDDAKAKAKTGQALREGYTRETVLRAQLLASVAVAAPPSTTTTNKRNHTIELGAEEGRSHKKARHEQPGEAHEFCTPVPTCYDDTCMHSTKEETRTPALPLKKQIMRRMKEDLLRENQLSAFVTLRECL